MQALLSIHDVMPETLDRVEALLSLVPAPARPGTVLLVVPGRDWRPGDLARLGCWQSRGLELAGHGWFHRAERVRGWYHRCHARLISRQAAEHLSQPRVALKALMADNHRWFAAHRLAPPDLYVPPAWALGNLTLQDLAESPFAYVETTSGLLHTASGTRRRLPLVGFEADTALRALGLRFWNRCNQGLTRERRPLRIALHPDDASLNLARDLRQTLDSLTRCIDYRALFH
ncbi:polysaccharide deacetylase family protein [Marinimicrobium sp. C6131]|uniref:polysaccharide deacetylase family protein n=1 Tax=Marinimicrobium sp. C6131 TaxID=3022676 RepID=UPI00223E1FD4|nr:polysaccharide deacetylase family protein [Marinimicrobium sp. C6131]UZJ43843.1 polysaccharide deacetylase family protein [Marinimicrobium sp. C6131]